MALRQCGIGHCSLPLRHFAHQKRRDSDRGPDSASLGPYVSGKLGGAIEGLPTSSFEILSRIQNVFCWGICISMRSEFHGQVQGRPKSGYPRIRRLVTGLSGLWARSSLTETDLQIVIKKMGRASRTPRVNSGW